MNNLDRELPSIYRSSQSLVARLLQEDHGSLEEEYLRLRVTEFLLLLTKLARVESLSTARVLELGCGPGVGLLLWSNIAGQVCGIDLPEVAEKARHLVNRVGADADITVLTSRAEDDLHKAGTFDLVMTQYVLEHVDDMDRVIENTRRLVTPTGHVVHVLNNLVDRHDWHLAYRLQTSPLRRYVHSVRSRGLRKTLRKPLNFTIPHEPSFGSFEDELRAYRLESWARRLIEQGFQIVDFFQTREVNWVLVCRPLPSD